MIRFARPASWSGISCRADTSRIARKAATARKVSAKKSTVNAIIRESPADLLASARIAPTASVPTTADRRKTSKSSTSKARVISQIYSETNVILLFSSYHKLSLLPSIYYWIHYVYSVIYNYIQRSYLQSLSYQRNLDWYTFPPKTSALKLGFERMRSLSISAMLFVCPPWYTE